MFDFTKKKNPEIEMQKKSGINLEKKVQLEKRTEKVGIVLKKKGLVGEKAQVVFVLDHSGSMRQLYNNGTVQSTLERIFPIALNFDDDGDMQFYLFDTNYQELDSVNINNYDEYTSEVILKKMNRYGQTNYAPVMNEIINQYAVKQKSETPTFVIFITDGDNGDKPATKKSLIEASKYNIFWKYVGIGKTDFPFLEKLDDLKDRVVDNANYIAIDDLNAISDDKLYEELMEEYDLWIKSARSKGIVK